MSASGRKPTWRHVRATSALSPTTDIGWRRLYESRFSYLLSRRRFAAERRGGPGARIGRALLRRLARERHPARAKPAARRDLELDAPRIGRAGEAEGLPGNQGLGYDARLVGAEIERLRARHRRTGGAVMLRRRAFAQHRRPRRGSRRRSPRR